MAGHYGTNRPVLHPSFEIQKHINQSEKPLQKGHTGNSTNNVGNKDETVGQYNHLLMLSNENKTGRNISIEDLKTGKCQSNHSPLLTKRKNSQRKTGSTSVRNKYKQQKNRNKFVSLNGNLRRLDDFNVFEDRKSTER